MPCVWNQDILHRMHRRAFSGRDADYNDIRYDTPAAGNRCASHSESSKDRAPRDSNRVGLRGMKVSWYDVVLNLLGKN